MSAPALPPLLWLVLCVLASYRLAYLVAIDTGPARIFERLRSWVGIRYGFESWQYEGIRCPICQTVWYSALMLFLVFEIGGFAQWIVLWLAIACGGLALHWWVLALMALTKPGE